MVLDGAFVPRYAYLHQRADLRVSRGVIPVGFYSHMLLDEGQPLYLETRVTTEEMQVGLVKISLR